MACPSLSTDHPDGRFARVVRLWVVLPLAAAVFVSTDSDTQAAEPNPEPSLIEDTVYHAVIDFRASKLRINYGPYELVACRFTCRNDSDDVADFAEEWQANRHTRWQTVRARGVWAGKPAVSDTVVNIVSGIANVDPDNIRRILPDRFRVDITGGFQIIGLTPDGVAMHPGFAESWSDFSSQLLSLGQIRTLTIEVSSADAQTLYYALEPGTPIVIRAEPHRGP